MCWNASVSLNTYIFALFGLIIGYINNFDRKFLLLGALFSFIQFIEYMLWSNFDNKNMNRLWSIIGFIVIILEPYATINMLNSGMLKNILFAWYSIIIGLNITFYKHNFITTIAKNKHLEWRWLPNFITLPSILLWITWFVAILLPLMIRSKDNMDYRYITIIIIGTLIMSLYFYVTTNSFGSMWCWSSNLIWLYVIYKSFTICYKNK
ncbi:MAG: hypothetical protein EBU66_15575 [Bacteroidetes bacterium]|nr:hypothetical protein [Bacteroidota bacterium]